MSSYPSQITAGAQNPQYSSYGPQGQENRRPTPSPGYGTQNNANSLIRPQFQNYGKPPANRNFGTQPSQNSMYGQPPQGYRKPPSNQNYGVPPGVNPVYGSQVQGYRKPPANHNYGAQSNANSIRYIPQLPNNRQSYQQQNYQINQPQPQNINPQLPQAPSSVAGPQNRYTFTGLQEATPAPITTTSDPEMLSEEEVSAYLRIQSLLKKFNKK